MITTDQLNARTLKYYDDSIAKMIEMIDKLETVHIDLDRIRAANESSSSKLIDAVQKSGQHIN